MKKASKITSVVLSVFSVIYFVLFFVIYKNNSYRIEFSLEWYWIIFSASVVLLHLTSTFFAKSVVADYISLASLLPYVCFSEIAYVIRIVLLLGYGVIYLYHNNRVFKTKGFPSGASGKEPVCQCRRHNKLRFDP